MLQEIAHELTTVGLGFISGALTAHFFPLWRERRKEFNDVAEPVRIILRAQMVEVTPYNLFPSSAQWDSVIERTRWWRRGCLRKAITAYQDACKQNQSQDHTYGGTQYISTTHITAAIIKALPMLAHR